METIEIINVIFVGVGLVVLTIASTSFVMVCNKLHKLLTELIEEEEE